jgi:hypothetical protein
MSTWTPQPRVYAPEKQMIFLVVSSLADFTSASSVPLTSVPEFGVDGLVDLSRMIGDLTAADILLE